MFSLTLMLRAQYENRTRIVRTTSESSTVELIEPLRGKGGVDDPYRRLELRQRPSGKDDSYDSDCTVG